MILFSDRAEFPAWKVFSVLWIGIVQVDGPGGGNKGVGEPEMLLYVLLSKDNVAEQTAGFAFAADIGDPDEFAVGIFGLITTVVLQKGPVAEDGTEGMIANRFNIGNLVPIHSGLPVPVSTGKVLGGFVIKPQRPGTFRKGTGGISLA